MTADDTTISKQHAAPMHLYYGAGDAGELQSLTSSRPLPVRATTQASEAGDIRVSNAEPYIQASASYNKRPANFREFTALSGTVGYANREFSAGCSTTIASYGTLRSFRSINYRTGFGGLVRFKARYTEGLALTQQAVGAFNIGDELSFGYNGTDFGVFHRYGGLAEVQKLTVTGAAGGPENATLTLNGTAHTIPLTSGTTSQNAREIAEWLQANQSAVKAFQNGSTVRITWLSDGDKTGTMSFSSSSATAALSETTAGVTKTTNHIAQSDWNGNVPQDFDPTKYNSYQITYSGNAQFWIQRPTTGEWLLAHTIQYLNSSTSPLVGDPSLHIGLYAFNVGGSNAVTAYCSEMAAFVEGKTQPIRNPRTAKNTKSISTTETAILTLRNVETINGVANQVEIEPRYLTLANAGNRQATFRILGNATLGGTYNYVYENEDNLISEVDTSGTTVSGGTELASFVVAPGESQPIDLSPFRIRVPPSLALTVTAVQNSGGSSGNQTVAITWYEDV